LKAVTLDKPIAQIESDRNPPVLRNMAEFLRQD
jgi:hypothetical protein